jgi:hypothetical protein
VSFIGLHIEGVNFTASAARRSVIKMSNSRASFIGCFFQDLRTAVTGVTKLDIFEIGGFADSSVTLDSCVFTTYTASFGAVLFRYNSESFCRFNVQGISERSITFDAASPSWWGLTEGLLPAGYRASHQDHFTRTKSGTILTDWDVSTNLSPPAATLVVSPVAPAARPGVLRLQSGTTNFMATLMELPEMRCRTGGGTMRLKCAFLVDTVAAASTDEHHLFIGFRDKATAAANTATDEIGLRIAISLLSDSRISHTHRSAAGNTSSTVLALAVANTWYEFEIVVEPEARRSTLFWGPDGGRAENGPVAITTLLPLSSVDLVPAIQLVKRGASASTNASVYIDYFEAIYAPNGIGNK